MFNSNNQTISISKCANGWLVELPMQIPPPEFRHMVDAIKEVQEELHGDEILNKVRKEAMEEQKAVPFVPVNHGSHVFKTFPKVLKFLKDAVK